MEPPSRIADQGLLCAFFCRLGLLSRAPLLQSLMKSASLTLRKCSSPVTTLAFASRACTRTIESASPHPATFFFISTAFSPAIIAVSKVRSRIWLEALMNSM